jgi:hypothetical protein
MKSRLFLAVISLFGLSTTLLAQNPYQQLQRQQRMQQQQQQQQQMMGQAAQPIDIQGTLEGVTREGIVVAAEDANQRRQIVVPPKAKVEVSGKATADYLQSGQIVEFEAEIENRLIKGKVGNLTIVALTADNPLGIFPAAGGVDAGGKATAPASKNLANGVYRIVGKLAIARGSAAKLSVLAGRKKLLFALDDQPTVSIRSADFTLASPGDKVSGKAVMMPSRTGPMLCATELKIELAETISGPRKKDTAAKSDLKRPAKSAKEKAPEGLPEQK